MMKFLRISILPFLFLFFFSFTTTIFACTDFRLMGKDGTVIVTRSLEFAADLQSNLRTSTRARLFTTTAPNGKAGMSWQAKYGYVYLDGMNVDAAVDGMNEKGLSFEALYLPNFTQYQTVPLGHETQALPYLSMGDWILSNFASVAEVRQALQNVYVFGQPLAAAQNMIFPLHFSIFDATGKGIVVEYTNGQLHIFDNPIGVLTNSPTYDWQILNLNNYVHLTPTNPVPVLDNGLTFAATGQGFGMIGTPGDISPPSRFVKIATMLRVVIPTMNAADTLNLAEHIINNVDIPLGLARELNQNTYTSELTQWVVFKDLTHGMFYYRTYSNTALRGISLAKLNFAPNAPRLKMPITAPAAYQDVTQQLLKSPQ